MYKTIATLSSILLSYGLLLLANGLFATLLGWQETNDAYWIGRYEQLWELAWQHYVDWTHGEWRQKLNRDLSPFAGTVALPVKDPFHLPRSLILQIELLESGQPPTVATPFSH